MPKEFITIADLTPDERNANRGTLRGSQLLEKSLREYGAGRSALADKNGKIIAGNKTIEGAASIGMEEAIFVHSDGTRPVIVIRDDLDLSDPGGKAQAMAIADNRVGQVSLEWNPDVLAELQTDGVDLEAFWFEDELSKILNSFEVPDFSAVGIEEQGRLDEKAKCTCPNCGHLFTP